MTPMSDDARNAQRAADACPDTARTEFGVVLFDLVLHLLDAAEVANSLDAELEGCIRVSNYQRPRVVLHG